jgi:hypothetical protein
MKTRPPFWRDWLALAAAVALNLFTAACVAVERWLESVGGQRRPVRPRPGGDLGPGRGRAVRAGAGRGGGVVRTRKRMPLTSEGGVTE